MASAWKGFVVAGLLGTLGLVGCERRESVGEEVREAGQAVGGEAREAGREVEGGLREGTGGAGREDDANIGENEGVINDGEGPLENDRGPLEEGSLEPGRDGDQER